MGSVTVDVPDEMEQHLRQQVADSEDYETVADLLHDMLQVQQDVDLTHIQRAIRLLEDGRDEEAAEAAQKAYEEMERARRRLSEVADPPGLSEEAAEKVGQSKQDFENGDFSLLEQA